QSGDQSLIAAPHAIGTEEVLEALGSSVTGLSAADAASRLERHGPNALPTGTQEPAWKRLLRQFHDPMIYVLIGAAVLTTVMGHLIRSEERRVGKEWRSRGGGDREKRQEERRAG